MAFATYMLGARQSKPVAASSVDPGAYFDQSAAIDDRIRALEAAVAEERNARQFLEDELQILYAEIEQLNDERSAQDERDEQQVADRREVQERIEEFRQRPQWSGAMKVARKDS